MRETGRMRNSQGREWAPVQDQSQEPQSRAHDSCIGSVNRFSEDAWAAWTARSAIDGIKFKVPTACKPSDENCKPTLIDSCMYFRGEGLQTQKDQKQRKFSPQSSARFQLTTKTPVFALRVATPSGAPRQAPLEERNNFIIL